MLEWWRSYCVFAVLCNMSCFQRQPMPFPKSGRPLREWVVLFLSIATFPFVPPGEPLVRRLKWPRIVNSSPETWITIQKPNRIPVIEHINGKKNTSILYPCIQIRVSQNGSIPCYHPFYRWIHRKPSSYSGISIFGKPRKFENEWWMIMNDL